MSVHTTSGGLRDLRFSNGCVAAQKLHSFITIRTTSASVPYVESCKECGHIDGASLDAYVEDAVKRSLSERAARIAVATETKPFAFVQSEGKELTLEEVLFQALGAASVCWEERALLSAGTFDSSRAGAIGKALLAEVQRFMRLAEKGEKS